MYPFSAVEHSTQLFVVKSHLFYSGGILFWLNECGFIIGTPEDCGYVIRMGARGGTDRGSLAWQSRSLHAQINVLLRRVQSPRDKQAHLVIAAMLLLFEALLSAVIIIKVPCKSKQSTHMPNNRTDLQHSYGMIIDKLKAQISIT